MGSSLYPPRPSTPTVEQIDANFEACLSAQELARTQGKRPFVAILVGPNNASVLLTHFSISHVEHAEASLARLAAIHFTPAYLWVCTLYSTWEPCATCAATCYWANIGRVVYAASEARLLELTGEGNEENMTLSLPCRDIFAKGQKNVQVWGLIARWEERVVAESDKYWKPIREGKA
ncbi:cmp/dcmp deaminase, zinc-binding protein [Zopfia rhizophila CBS 207.26]|uniref:Cmp/dcmp deaminase, zinc-binding protein n=1 Tax=Zopfia rhizophila CBS 207.26 TaxID=1314779 RepID=A0A6A6ENU1_9PEZI|nr:cmp/dcmp deaminase, zinc-binding protein [Zopfia rhizophila CBS 207.26]